MKCIKWKRLSPLSAEVMFKNCIIQSSKTCSFHVKVQDNTVQKMEQKRKTFCLSRVETGFQMHQMRLNVQEVSIWCLRQLKGSLMLKTPLDIWSVEWYCATQQEHFLSFKNEGSFSDSANITNRQYYIEANTFWRCRKKWYYGGIMKCFRCLFKRRMDVLSLVCYLTYHLMETM